MRTLNEIIASVLDQLAPLPSGPQTPLGTPAAPQDALMAEFEIASPQHDKWPAHLPTTIEKLERRRVQQLLLVRLGEMIRLGEIRPRHPQTGDTVRDLGWEVQLSDYDRLVLDEADEERFRGRYPACGMPVSCADDCVPGPIYDEVSEPDHAVQQGTKQDALQIELLDILEKMHAADERITAGTVMPKLRARAGERTTCVVEECSEGVIWSRSRGDVEKLTSKALQGRIDRWRGKKPR